MKTINSDEIHRVGQVLMERHSVREAAILLAIWVQLYLEGEDVVIGRYPRATRFRYMALLLQAGLATKEINGDPVVARIPTQDSTLRSVLSKSQ